MATEKTRGKLSPADKSKSEHLISLTLADSKYPSRDELLKYFSYDPATGSLTNKIARGRAIAGAEAGTNLKMRHGINDRFYRRVCFKGQQFLAHVLIIIVTGGTITAGHEVDHKNGVSHDNRIANLRVVTHTENMNNTKRHRAKPAGQLQLALAA